MPLLPFFCRLRKRTFSVEVHRVRTMHRKLAENEKAQAAEVDRGVKNKWNFRWLAEILFTIKVFMN